MKSLFSRYFAKVGSFRSYSIERDNLVSISQPFDNKTRRSLDRITYFFRASGQKDKHFETVLENHADRVSLFQKRSKRSLISSSERIRDVCKQRTGTNPLIIPQYLKVTATPISPEYPDNSFVIFDSNENEENS